MSTKLATIYIFLTSLSFRPDIKTRCEHSYKGPKNRRSRILPNFSEHQFIKKAEDLKDVWIRFQGSPYIFSGLGETFPNLEMISIRYSHLEFIERNDFANLEKLKMLDITENPMGFIPEDAFWDLHGLEKLWIFISNVERFPKKLFMNLKKLKELNIQDNKLNRIDKELFDNLESLEDLNLQNNYRVKKVDEDVFWGLKSLVKLNIDTLLLEILPVKIFINMTKLRILNASFNKIKYLHKDLFKNNPQLESINFKGNELNRIDLDFSKFARLSLLDLTTNKCIDEALPEKNITEIQTCIRCQCQDQPLSCLQPFQKN